MVMLTPELIFEVRKALGLTAKEFGDLLDSHWNTVFQWESGRRHPRWETQVKINRLLEEAKERGLMNRVA